MKILVGVPTTGMVHSDFMRSMMAMKKPAVPITYAFTEDSTIYEARNKFARLAIEGDFDYLFMADSDMVMPEHALNTLLAHDKDIVSGFAFKRRYPFSPCANKIFRPLGDKIEVLPLLEWEDQLEEVESVGMACVLIKVDVLKAIGDKWFTPFHNKVDVYEDFAFCLRARDKGYKIYVDTALIVPHLGKFQVTEEHYIQTVHEKLEAGKEI